MGRTRRGEREDRLLGLALDPPDPAAALPGALSINQTLDAQPVEEDRRRVGAPHHPFLRLSLDLPGGQGLPRCLQDLEDQVDGLVPLKPSDRHLGD